MPYIYPFWIALGYPVWIIVPNAARHPPQGERRWEMGMTKFYTFHQNNSGGSFDHDAADGIGYLVIIEANSAEHANERAERIGLYFDGCKDGRDCSCCGDRWYRVDESDGDDVPSKYGRPITDSLPMEWGIPSYVHYLGVEGIVRFPKEAK